MINLKTLSKTLSPQKKQDLQSLFANVPQTLLEEAKIIQIPKNTTFIDAGEEASSIYILIKGRGKAADYRISEVVYDYTWFEPIEMFGAMEFYMGYDQYITTLITTTDCTLITFPSGIFRKWLETDVPTLLDQIWCVLPLFWLCSVSYLSAKPQATKSNLPKPPRTAQLDFLVFAEKIRETKIWLHASHKTPENIVIPCYFMV